MTQEIWRPLKDMQKEKLWYAIVTRDRYGEVVARERRKSHSFVRAWNELIYVQMTNLAINITDTGGVARSTDPATQDFRMEAALGDTDYGIRVGTGNTAVDISDFALDTAIVEGLAGGQMEHLVCTIDDSVVGAPSCSYIVHRTIVNNSGGLINVLEAGIYIRMDTWYGLALRDVLTVPQAVPDGGGITIDWTIGVTI